jgi:hypothetical protein
VPRTTVTNSRPTSRPTTGRRFLTSSAAAVLAAAGALAVPSTASAAVCDPEEAAAATSVSSGSVAVGTTKTKTLTFDVYTKAGCTDLVVAAVQDPRGAKWLVLSDVGLTSGGRDHWQARLAIAPKTLENSDAGVWPVRYTIVDGEVARTAGEDAEVRRAARITFNAGPEPVRNGRITYSGTLERASWDTGRYRPYGNQRVDLHRTVPGDPEEDFIATVRTNREGRYRHTERFRGAGHYQSQSGTNRTTASAVSRVDAVAAPR